jgi:hypothetical protein
MINKVSTGMDYNGFDICHRGNTFILVTCGKQLTVRSGEGLK